MTYLFTQLNRGLLETFASSNLLLAFDYDGTLAPLVSTPALATMRASTRTWLQRVSTLYPCVVITGRARADALVRLRNIEVCRVVGNHGAEPSPNAEAMRRRVQKWLPFLKRRLSTRQGVVIEDKEFSVAIHYRHALRREATRRAILATHDRSTTRESSEASWSSIWLCRRPSIKEVRWNASECTSGAILLSTSGMTKPMKMSSSSIVPGDCCPSEWEEIERLRRRTISAISWK